MEGHMLKLTAALCLMFVSVSASADPTQEMRQMTRALINNVDIVKQLKENETSFMGQFKMTEVKQGVFQYDFVFSRSCECMPATATVSILEDMTPTYSDGAPEYKSSIQIKGGN